VPAAIGEERSVGLELLFARSTSWLGKTFQSWLWMRGGRVPGGSRGTASLLIGIWTAKVERLVTCSFIDGYFEDAWRFSGGECPVLPILCSWTAMEMEVR
jgi:hypothetical protein